MTLTALTRTAALAALVTTGLTVGAPAQTIMSVPQQPGASLAQAEPSPEEEQQGEEPGQPGPMHPGMMHPGMMPPGMMHPGMMGERMRGRLPMMGVPWMKILFAIADTDNDGSLTFEEVTTIHKRIFDAIDTNKDGKITLEEIQAFMWE